MAIKDMGRGWGAINARYTYWRCPKKKEAYPVEEWAIVTHPTLGIDGRKCPNCNWTAYQVGESEEMVPRPEEDIKIKGKKK